MVVTIANQIKSVWEAIILAGRSAKKQPVAAWGFFLRDTQSDYFKWDFGNTNDKMSGIFNLNWNYLLLTLT